MRRTGVQGAVALMTGAILVGGCQLEDNEPPPPTGPSEVKTTSSAGTAAPVLGITADPTPSPAPSPGTPEPNPSPEPPPAGPTSGSGACHLPPSTPANPTCTTSSPELLVEVEAAIDAVTERFPELFDFNDTRCGNCYYVKDPHRYIDEVVRQLGRQGVCVAGGYEEIGVKISNDYSEQYDIILATDHVRRGRGAYRGVCFPATF